MWRSLIHATPLLILLACGTDAGDDVIVSVASSQTEIFEAIVPEVNSSVGEDRIELNFAGSTTLVNQVNEGAPVAIVVVADRFAVDQLNVPVFGEEMIAENHIVAVAHSSVAPVSSFAELADTDLVIAGCDTSVPCGRLTYDWLRQENHQPTIDTREQNVRQVLARVESGEADVGFVYESDATRLNDASAAQLLDLGRSQTISDSWAVLLTNDPATRVIFDRLVLESRQLNGLRP